MYYEGNCGSCINFTEINGGAYDEHNASYVKGFCTYYRSYYYPDDSCRGHYEARQSSEGCYITTIVCTVLGEKDDCELMETLRVFRSQILQKDQKYRNILFEYDFIGPMIAQRLREEDPSFVRQIYDHFLVPIVSSIHEKRNEDAIQKYIEMTKSLKECYGIEVTLKTPSSYDYQNGGHGVQKVKNSKEEK